MLLTYEHTSYHPNKSVNENKKLEECDSSDKDT